MAATRYAARVGILNKLSDWLTPAVKIPQLMPMASATFDLVETRAVDDELGRVLQNVVGMVRRSEAPRRGSPELLLSYSRLPHIRSVVGKTAGIAAAVHWQVKRVSANGLEKIADPSHEFQKLWDAPNPKLSGSEQRKMIFAHLLLIGEAFISIERDKRGRPAELWVIPPTWVISTPDMAGDSFEVRMPGAPASVDVKAGDMIWVRDPNPVNPYGRGTGVAAALGDELDTDEFAAKHLKAWFLNHCTPSYIFSLENAGKEATELAAQGFREKNLGPANNNRVHWTNGKLTATRLEDEFDDEGIIHVREYEATLVRETIGIPPEIVGHVVNSNRSTIEAGREIMAEFVVQPLLDLLQSAVNVKIQGQFQGSVVVIEANNPVPESKTFKLDVMKSQPSAFKINDWRRLAGETPTEDGENYVLNTAVFAPVSSFNPAAFAAEAASTAATIAGDTAVATEAAKSLPPRTTKATVIKSAAPSEKSIKAALKKNASSKVIEPAAKKTIKAMGQAAVKESTLPTPFDWKSSTANYLRNNSSSKIKEIDEHTAELIQIQLTEGYLEGESIPDLKARVRGAFGFGPDATAANARAISARARTIARTETLRASNVARLDAFSQQAPGLVVGKGWLSVGDDGRNRESHLSYTGTVVPLDGNFEIDGVEMDCPCNSGDPQQDINCRCTSLPVLDGDEKSFTVGNNTSIALKVHKSFSRDVKYHETQLLVDINANLKKQMQSVFALLE